MNDRGLGEAANRLVDQLEKLAPGVWEAAAAGVRNEAIANLVGITVFTALLSAAGIRARKWWHEKGDYGMETGRAFFSWVVSVVAVVAILVTCGFVPHYVNQIVNPEQYVVKNLLRSCE